MNSLPGFRPLLHPPAARAESLFLELPHAGRRALNESYQYQIPIKAQNPLKDQFQGKLDLSWRVRGVGFHEVLWLLIVAWVGSIPNLG
jgi:hypothetical protein